MTSAPAVLAAQIISVAITPKAIHGVRLGENSQNALYIVEQADPNTSVWRARMAGKILVPYGEDVASFVVHLGFRGERPINQMGDLFELLDEKLQKAWPRALKVLEMVSKETQIHLPALDWMLTWAERLPIDKREQPAIILNLSEDRAYDDSSFDHQNYIGVDIGSSTANDEDLAKALLSRQPRDRTMRDIQDQIHEK